MENECKGSSFQWRLTLDLEKFSSFSHIYIERISFHRRELKVDSLHALHGRIIGFLHFMPYMY